MCTVVLATRQRRGLPLALAMNRDEKLDRPAAPPERREGPVPYVAPRDLTAGGTWLGVNAHGVVAAITNRFGRKPDPSRRSRGLLVTDALAFVSATSAARALVGVDPQDYNGFHLVLADKKAAYVVYTTAEDVIACERLPPGVHVVSESSFGARDATRDAMLRGHLGGGERWDTAALRPLLAIASPAADPMQGTCVHVPSFNYGTRSSTLIELPTRGAGSLHYMDGSPCDPGAVYQDYSGLLAGL